MTNITLHGSLGKKFGKTFKIKVSDAFSALKAIDANRYGFMQKILSLNQRGEGYCVIVDGETLVNKDQLKEKRKINKIDIVPIIFGYGPAFAAIPFLTTFLNIAISIGLQFLLNSLMKQGQPPNPQVYVTVGGNTSSVEAAGKSYVFSNPQNVAEQGSSIPVGYGRAKSSSKIILNSMKNYSTNMNFQEESSAFINRQIAFYNDFLTQ